MKIGEYTRRLIAACVFLFITGIAGAAEYYPATTCANQAAATSGCTQAIVTAIGTSKDATIVFKHSGSGNTTSYAFTTDVTIPAKINVVVQDGATFTGSGKLIIANPSVNIQSKWYGKTIAGVQKALDAVGEHGRVTINNIGSAYSSSATLDVDTNDYVTIDFEPGVEIDMASDGVDCIDITKDHITINGNGALLKGSGTFSEASGTSLIKATGDYNIIRGLQLEDAEKTAIRIETDSTDNIIEYNTIIGGPLYADAAAIGSVRSIGGIWLRGETSGSGYGSSRNIVRGNTIKPNATGGKPIQGIVAGHVTHPSMDNIIEDNILLGCWDHGIYIYAEGNIIRNNILRQANGIKVHMRPSGTAERGNVISGNSGNNYGMETSPLTGDAFIILGNAEWTTVTGNTGVNFQNAGILIAGTTSPYKCQKNIFSGNIIDTLTSTNSTYNGGFVVYDSNLAYFADNQIINNTFANIGTDGTGAQAGILFGAIADGSNHTGNRIDGNTITGIQEQGAYLARLTGGSFSNNYIYNSGQTTAGPAVDLVDVRNFKFNNNRLLGVGSQMTYGFNPDSDTKYNWFTDNFIVTAATGMFPSTLNITNYATNNTNNTSNGEQIVYNTAGDRTIAAAELLVKVNRRDPNGSNRTDTTCAAADMIALFLPYIGASHETLYVNTTDASETITLGAGSGVTLYNNEGAADAIIPVGGAAKLTIFRNGTSTVIVFVTVYEAV